MILLLADDLQLVREALFSLLRAEAPDVEVTLAATLEEVLGLLEAGRRFDLIVLDHDMPGMNGFLGLSSVKARVGRVPVAILSGATSRSFGDAALAAGADGFIPKSLPAHRMIRALRFMAEGERYFPADLGDRTGGAAPVRRPFAARLTERELQVLERLCRGLANKEIARELGLQLVTVKLHVKTLCRKLEARNRTHAAILAKEAGLF